MVIDILYICWNNNTEMIPPMAYLSVKFFVLLTEFINVKSKYIIIKISDIEPINPVLDANTANIKSVCISGKYIGVLFIPWPVNPDEPMAIREFLN